MEGCKSQFGGFVCHRELRLRRLVGKFAHRRLGEEVVYFYVEHSIKTKPGVNNDLRADPNYDGITRTSGLQRQGAEKKGPQMYAKLARFP